MVAARQARSDSGAAWPAVAARQAVRDSGAAWPAPVGELDQQLRSYLLLLRDEHREQIEHLERSGQRLALWTFAGGVLLGFLGNVVVAVLRS